MLNRELEPEGILKSIEAAGLITCKGYELGGMWVRRRLSANEAERFRSEVVLSGAMR